MATLATKNKRNPLEVDFNPPVDEIDLENLDITNQDIDFNEIEDMMSTLQHDPRVRDVLLKEVDMREYSRQIENELRQVERESVEDYVASASALADLHQQIVGCDEILERMEKLLTGFQADLGNISHEIKSLQDLSSSMSIKLRNRKNIETKLCSFIEEIVLPPNLVKQICNAEVDEGYVEHLVALNKKIEFAKEQLSSKTVAVNDVYPELANLRNTAVTKTREHLLWKISCLKKGNSNVQIQQQMLLKVKYLNEFVRAHSKETYNEIKTHYQETMNKISFSSCKTYLNNLLKLLIEIGSKNDLLAAPEGSLKGFFSDKFSKDRSNVFSLGNPSRALILKNLEAPDIVPHEAQQNNTKYPYECLFRSFNHYLIEAVTTESIFETDFFPQDCEQIMPLIFEKSTSYFLETFQGFLSNCFDTVGILIMININDYNQQSMKKRGISCLNPYFETTNTYLWPRLIRLMSLHIENIQMATPKLLGSIDIRPHYVTRRYAEFLASIFALNNKDEHLVKVTKLLRNQMHRLLRKLSREFEKPPLNKDPKSPIIFLLNNYDHILSVLNERGISPEDSADIQAKLNEQMGQFVEAELFRYFKNLISFVKKFSFLLRTNTTASTSSTTSTTTELMPQKQEKKKQKLPEQSDEVDDDEEEDDGDEEDNQSKRLHKPPPDVTNFSSDEPDLNMNKDMVEGLIKEFASHWRGEEKGKGILSRMRDDVMVYFSNFKMGATILNQTLTQLVIYYASFDEIVRMSFKQESFLKDLVTINVLTYQVKKYSITF